MTMIKTTCLAGCTLLVLTCNVFAEVSANSAFAKSAPMAAINGGANSAQAPNYLGASIGSTTTDGFCNGLSACESTAKSWKAFAGVRMNENIVLESGYVDFGKQAGIASNGSTVGQQASAYTAAAIAGVPVNDQIEAFGKAGVARWAVDTTTSTTTTASKGTDVLIGAGANYDFGNNMGVRAEWERYKDVGSDATHNNDIDLLSLGFIFSSL
jgi:opacity protein-like surface antigen